MSSNKFAAKLLRALTKSSITQPGPGYDLSSGSTIEVISETADVQYIHYKRRWYGVTIWLLMNLMTSWGVRFPSPSVSTVTNLLGSYGQWLTYTTIITASADFYSVSENAVNNFSIIYMGCLVAFSP